MLAPEFDASTHVAWMSKPERLLAMLEPASTPMAMPLKRCWQAVP